MQIPLKEQIANAISLSFIETMTRKAPELEEKILKGEIKKIDFLPVILEGKTHIKCVAGDIVFTFPLKPMFLKKIEEQKSEIIEEKISQRIPEQQKPLALD